ncbi:MAG: Ig-like domain-containing protein [Acidimicrobiales bacterium]
MTQRVQGRVGRRRSIASSLLRLGIVIPLLGALTGAAILTSQLSGAGSHIRYGANGDTAYSVAAAPLVTTISNGTSSAPWNTSQGDPDFPDYATVPPGTLLPTYTPGGAEADSYPNLAVYPAADSGTDGDSPYPSGTVGTPGPLAGYCGTGNQVTASAGSPQRQPAGTTLPFAPAYFPHIVRNSDGSLTGYFDWRPKDTDEAIVVAKSTDNGKDWTYEGEALEQNPGYCPSADINDDGQGHPNVLTIGGTSRLYTLQRPAGDNVGVGMLVHTLNPTNSDPLNGVPSTEEVGIDPDAFATNTTSFTVPFTGGTPVTIPLNQTGLAGSPEQLTANSSAGGFVDLNATPTPNAGTVIKCTGSTSTSLTGCTTTASDGITINPNDLIEQVIGTTTGSTGSGTVPAGPNTTSGDGGLASIGVSFVTQTTAYILNANAPNRLYLNGVAIYCAQSNASPTTKIENCTTGPGNAPLAYTTGSVLTSDPIVPATATAQTNGLISPDGIVGVLPSYPGLPSGYTAVMYTEKILNYYVAGTTTNSGSVTFGTNFNLTFTPSASFQGVGGLPSDMPSPSSVTSASPVTVYMGDITASDIVSVTCTGETSTTLTGCNTSGPTTDQYNATSMIGAPGAAIVPTGTLNETGEGAGAAPSAKNVAKLMKNNEDLSLLRVAYTSDGINFTDSGLANSGIISDQGTTQASSYTGINDPNLQTSPSNLDQYAGGQSDATEMRFVGSAGSIITNPDGSYGLFLSGAWAADGDSDSFNQIFYSSSTNGQDWSVPVDLVSTDYTFSASSTQDASGGPLGVSAYYSGRAYGPSVVQNPNGTLTMVFAGYRLPKPIVDAGTVLGTNPSDQYTVGTDDPALYRNIMVVTLQSSTTPAVATTTSLATSDATPVVGEQVTYTATVAPVSPGTGTPTGTVTFTGSAGTLCTTSLDEDTSDQATCTATYAAPGSDSVTATYNADSNYATSTSSGQSETIGQDSTTTSLSSSNATPVVGQSLTFTATVAPVSPGAGTATGTVTFTGDSGTLCTSTLDEGATDTATCTIAYTSAGSDSVTAAYGGDSNDLTSSSSSQAESIAQDSTTTTLATTTNSPVVGQPVTYTATVATVSPGQGTPTGYVTFTGSSGVLCTTTLDGDASDQATCQTTYPASGSDSVTASYGGDTNDSTSSSAPPQAISIGAASTTTTISSSDASPVVGEQVTYTATVTATSPGAGTPTGTVTFTGNSGTLCTSTLNEAATDQATCQSTYTSVGTDSVSAGYAGDGNFGSSTSQPQTEAIGQAQTSTSIISSPTSPVVGEPVTYTATVTPTAPGAGTPTGSVTFAGNGGTICSGAALGQSSPDTATCDTTYSNTQGDTVTASYGGDTNFASSVSAPLSESVQEAPTTTTLSVDNAGPVVGQSVTFTATVAVSSPGTGTPGGSVTFSGDSGVLCTTSLNGDATDQATCATAYPATGTDSVTATYDGSTDFASSTSSPAQGVSISEASTTTSISTSESSPVVGQLVTYTATVSAVAPGAGTATGNVTFSGKEGTICTSALDSADQATCTTKYGSTGTDSLTASYAGDSNFTSSSSGAQAESIVAADTTTSISTNASSAVVGQHVTYTATVTPTAPGAGTATGKVTFTANAGTLCTSTLNGEDQATCTVTYSNPGTDSVTASYAGDPNFDGSASGPQAERISAAATQTTLSANVTNSQAGQQILFTAAVAAQSPGSGTPTGTVKFADSSGTLCIVTLDDSSPDQTTCPASYATTGKFTVTATYEGSTDFGASTSNQVTESVSAASTQTVITETSSPALTGETLKITASVEPVAPAGGSPGGTVDFSVTNGTNQALNCNGGNAQTIKSGKGAVCTVPAADITPAAEPLSIQAGYQGNGSYEPSQSTGTEQINPDPTTVTVASSANPANSGQAVTFTATVSAAAPGSGVPGGTVTFSFLPGGSLACTGTNPATLSPSGTATCKLAKGMLKSPVKVSATYGGSPDYVQKTGTLKETVK